VDQPGSPTGHTTPPTGPPPWSDNGTNRAPTLGQTTGPAWGLCSLPTHTFPCAIMINARKAGPDYYALLFSLVLQNRLPLPDSAFSKPPPTASPSREAFMPRILPRVCITPLGTGLGRSNILLSEISHKMQKYKNEKGIWCFFIFPFFKEKNRQISKKTIWTNVFSHFSFLRGEFLVPAFYTASKKE
jgi:hypothetical protein